MSLDHQNEFTPRTFARERRSTASTDGAKLVVASWPEGFKGSTYRFAAVLGQAASWCLGVGEQTLKGEMVADPCGQTPAQHRWARKLDAGRWPTAPLRVGIRVGHEFSRQLKHAPGSGGVQFVFVASNAADRAACQDLNLDAMVVPIQGGVKILSRAHRQREAAWFDWGASRPLSYPAVFPTRLDCSQVTIDDNPTSDVEIHLIRALVETAAACSRLDARLLTNDRWRGRKALDHSGVADEAMSRLAVVLQHASLGTIRAAHRAAARVLSAWAVTDRPAGFASPQRHLAELCARCAGNEAEVMLRLGAARFADLDDQGGRQALLAADRMLRTRPTLPGVDNSAFIQAELDQGRHDPLAVGRVAAGVVLACAAMPVEKLVFTQGDLLEEMRFSAWLVGRDQDRALLHRLTLDLVSQRRAEQLGLPAAQASEQAGADSGRAKNRKPRKSAGTKGSKPRTRTPAKATAQAKPRTRRASKPKSATSRKPASKPSQTPETGPIAIDQAAAQATPRRRRKAA